MIPVYSVAQIREAEARAFDALAPGELMTRAVTGLFAECRSVLKERRGGIYGSQVLILIGSGNNGADAMWTGQRLAQRGASVVAWCSTESIDEASSRALQDAGGRVVEYESVAESQKLASSRLVDTVDIVLDGLLGIGGKGGLREPAASWSLALTDSPAEVIAVDIPSGVDPDSGEVADEGAVILADRTVCLGSIKSGLFLARGPEFAGDVSFVDIGLMDYFIGDAEEGDSEDPKLRVVDFDDVLRVVGVLGREDNKYTRGVVGVVSGSAQYPGAAVLSAGGALVGGAGMVRYAGGAPEAVVERWPEVVIAERVDANSRTDSWVVGSGGGVDEAARDRLERVLEAKAPVVLDADALTLTSQSSELRERIRARRATGLVTILTPHEGEFERLGFSASSTNGIDRIEALKSAADSLGAVVLLKGATTLVATPSGHVFANDESSPELATAGSGDILAGLIGSLLAHSSARSDEPLSEVDVAYSAACAALIHGLGGIEAAEITGGVAATDILNGVREVLKNVG